MVNFLAKSINLCRIIQNTLIWTFPSIVFLTTLDIDLVTTYLNLLGRFHLLKLRIFLLLWRRSNVHHRVTSLSSHIFTLLRWFIRWRFLLAKSFVLNLGSYRTFVHCTRCILKINAVSRNGNFTYWRSILDIFLRCHIIVQIF